MRTLTWIVLGLSLVLGPLAARAGDDFDARYQLALSHVKDLQALSPKGPEWVLATSLSGSLDHMRATCGNTVDRNRDQISALLTDWVHEVFDRLHSMLARVLADHFTLAELRRFSFVDASRPSALDVVGEERANAYTVAHRNRIRLMKREKWVILKQNYAPKLREIAPCLGGAAISIKRS
ncbi:MAG: hypothetical protein ACFB03_01425 [Paracoccaceae bacterium]